MTESLNICFERFIAHYSEKYEVRQPATIASYEIAAFAEHHSRDNMSLMGIPMKTMGPQANEYVFLVDEPHFDLEAAERLESLTLAAERELVCAGPDHAFTFLSAVALCGSADEAALKIMRRLKIRRDYFRAGWVVARFVAIEENGRMTANGDGADLKHLLQRILKEPLSSIPRK